MFVQTQPDLAEVTMGCSQLEIHEVATLGMSAHIDVCGSRGALFGRSAIPSRIVPDLHVALEYLAGVTPCLKQKTRLLGSMCSYDVAMSVLLKP